MISIAADVHALGVNLKQKLIQPVVAGDPEEQLRTPLDQFLRAVATTLGFSDVNVIGEVKMAHVSSRPDFAVTIGGALTGFVEVKALGKGADPRSYRGHDKDQFARLRLLPNVLYTDAQCWSLWQNGELVGRVERLDGDVASAGATLGGPVRLEEMLLSFLCWKPIPPSSAGELAHVAARLCRLFKLEVAAELANGARTLRSTAEDWRNLLFPSASDAQFADGYAQAVMFGLLIARAKGIQIEQDTNAIGQQLGATNSLIGRALQVLGSVAEDESGLKAVLDAAKRTLSAVDWARIERGSKREAWLYFYEDFLGTYDAVLRKQTGSYYTPIPVVQAMTRLTDESVRTLLDRPSGLADDSVTLMDPAMGTGTFLLESLRLVAARHEQDYGPGSRGAALTRRLKKVIGFEIQLGPYAVAELRMLAEMAVLGSDATADDLRTYVADTLSDPNEDYAKIGQFYEPIAESRRKADKIKRDEEVLVVIGNPPYKEKAKGLGGWIETGAHTDFVPLDDFTPPKAWKLGPHLKNLRNLYVYFWRWASWKVFESVPADAPGIVAFITVTGFLDGDGFQQMRSWLRKQATDVFVIECSPEGLMPPVHTRIFQAVPHPVCIVIAVRRPGGSPEPATVLTRTLAPGDREEKFKELSAITLDDAGWALASADPRAPFAAVGDLDWTKHPSLEDLFIYNGSGVMPGRTWVIAPDPATLTTRAKALQNESDVSKQRELFSEGAGLRVDHKLKDALPGYPVRSAPVGSDSSVEAPIRYAFRTLDRQWIIPDKRVLNRPNPKLWAVASHTQVYITAPKVDVPSGAMAVSVAATPPGMDHYCGHGGGRVYPVWTGSGTTPNIRPGVLSMLSSTYERSVTADEVAAYIVGVTSHSVYIETFKDHLSTPEVRVPFTVDATLFGKVVELGQRSIWYQTYGQRMKVEGHSTSSGGTPRLPADRAPANIVPVPSASSRFPNTLAYDEATGRLSVGEGVISNVTPAMRDYAVGGVNVIDKWFSYRREDRTRPVIGKRRVSSLMNLQSDHWLDQYTRDLVDLLNAIGLLIDLEAEQAQALASLLDGDTIKGIAGAATTSADVATYIDGTAVSPDGQAGFDLGSL